jgi:alpha-beta hydrolase superfamily lysophospholipase
MGLITHVDGTAEGYEEVALPLIHDDPQAAQGRSAAVLRRRSAQPTKRAVIYLHCMHDAFVPADLACWYTDRGFHFYVADLRAPRAPRAPRGPAPDGRPDGPAEYFACLDAAVRHARDADGIETVVLCAHGSGALIAALWCHARRGGLPADALILTSPEFGPTGSWLARRVPGGEFGLPVRRPAPLLAGAQRRLRRGLDISCPVLVMCPSASWDAPGGSGGLLTARVLTGGRATMRLGAHVTWLKLEGALPGQALPDGPDRRRFFDELGRWLGAYLSGQVRDQLL